MALCALKGSLFGLLGLYGIIILILGRHNGSLYVWGRVVEDAPFHNVAALQLPESVGVVVPEHLPVVLVQLGLFLPVVLGQVLVAPELSKRTALAVELQPFPSLVPLLLVLLGLSFLVELAEELFFLSLLAEVFIVVVVLRLLEVPLQGLFLELEVGFVVVFLLLVVVDIEVETLLVRVVLDGRPLQVLVRLRLLRH